MVNYGGFYMKKLGIVQLAVVQILLIKKPVRAALFGDNEGATCFLMSANRARYPL